MLQSDTVAKFIPHTNILLSPSLALVVFLSESLGRAVASTLCAKIKSTSHFNHLQEQSAVLTYPICSVSFLLRPPLVLLFICLSIYKWKERLSFRLSVCSMHNFQTILLTDFKFGIGPANDMRKCSTKIGVVWTKVIKDLVK